MAIKQGYKVVWRRMDRKLVSFNSNKKLSDPECVHYIRGEWAKPKKGCGPLVLFDNLKNAKEFLLKFPFFVTSTAPLDTPVIFACQYTPSAEKKVWTSWLGHDGKERFFHTSNIKMIVEITRLGRGRRYGTGHGQLRGRYGVVLAKKIKLLGEPISLEE